MLVAVEERSQLKEQWKEKKIVTLPPKKTSMFLSMNCNTVIQNRSKVSYHLLYSFSRDESLTRESMKQKFCNKLRAIISRQKPFLGRVFSVHSPKIWRFCLMWKIADLFAAIDLSSFMGESFKLKVVVLFAWSTSIKKYKPWMKAIWKIKTPGKPLA